MMKLSSPFRGIILILFVMLGINSTSATTKYNVLNFGAKPNGRTDSTKAFLKAWNAARGSADSTLIYVPKGRYFLGPMAFKGECRSPQITIRIDGTLMAPVDYRVLGNSANWLSFEGVSGVSIIGGALDPKGPSLWACNSPNTNGIHVQLSRNVEIINCSVKTGDDCISFGPGTKHLWIERVTCGPDHGIRSDILKSHC